MKKTLFCVLVVMLMVCCAQADGVRLVEASDMHLLSRQLVEDENTLLRILRGADGKVTHYTPEICRAFVDKMLEEKPDAVLLSGDLTLNGSHESHRELIDILTPLKEAGIPVLVIPGNHDETGLSYRFTLEGAVPIEGMDEQEFKAAYADFGYNDARSRDESTFSYMYEVTPQVWVLAVDVNSVTPWGSVPTDTLAWIEGQLQAAQQAGAQVIGMTHQNLMVHFSMFTFGYQLNNARQLQELYDKYGVHLNLSGHLHLQHIAENGGVTEITTSALAVWPQHYGVITVEDGVAAYQAVPLDVAAWAEKEGITDHNLLDFSDYSARFFDDTTTGKQADRMQAIEADEEIKARMLDFVRIFNRSQFAGYLVEPIDMEELALWEEHMPSAFFTYYMSMFPKDGATDFRQATVRLN